LSRSPLAASAVSGLRRERPAPPGVGETPRRTNAFDAVECDQICLRGQPVGLALSLGSRLQFFTTLEALTDLDGERFADRASLLAQVRSRLP
jgi:hypothetical protein